MDDILALTGLATVADKAIGTFSLGMSQRLVIANALLADPQILVLDEPINGLDPGDMDILAAMTPAGGLQLAPWQGLLVLLVYLAAFAAAATAATQRKDV